MFNFVVDSKNSLAYQTFSHNEFHSILLIDEIITIYLNFLVDSKYCLTYQTIKF